jgi:hypothetical protein
MDLLVQKLGEYLAQGEGKMVSEILSNISGQYALFVNQSLELA